jgi:hypothetical protein
MTRRLAALLFAVAGAIVAVAGVALIYPPAAMILGGVALCAAALRTDVG